jgi:L-ascorbate metabolism protein UlaG (beta-lactamase superfamily)
MKIKFLGHASFLITSERGIRIITDPYKPGCFNGGIKYAPITEEADVVTISHEHDDHNATDIDGNPTFVRGSGRKDLKDIKIQGYDVFHDESGGKERGKNTIFQMTVDGMSIVHLGDLGHPLSDNDIEKLGAVDILFVPVGGHFTIDAEIAEKTVSRLQPKIVVPMHYKTDKCGFPIASVEDYLINKEAKKLSGEFEITKETLPEETTTFVLTPTK